MREILFRGKRTDNGEWVEGAFSQKDCDDPFGQLVDRPSIIKYDEPFSGFWFRVDPSTVGQYTGLKDKNGKKIFEGDVIRYLDGDSAPEAVVKFGTARNFEVGFYLEWEAGQPCLRQDLAFWTSERDIEVIGNIHDNPEPPKEETK